MEVEIRQLDCKSLVEAAIEELPQAQREIVLACDLGGASVSEVAISKHLDYHNAKSIRRRALERLAKNPTLKSLIN
jgi:DNA-directed RNA polymerase specialized sigma24 family protein